SWCNWRAIEMTDGRPAEATDQRAARTPNSRLAEIVDENIKTLVALKRHRGQQRSLEERAADSITRFSGSMTFVYLHVGVFAVWMVLGNGWLGVPKFDPYPYQLLTMAVSLEAIFLSTFVLVSQNRMAMEADRRADLDLHVDLLTEHELTRALRMLDQIQEKLGIANADDRELRDLEVECTPTAVMEHLEWAEAQREL
ncbi:MAG: DUF1003 domain-containing protein, partial [Actinomycetota bacterium]